jgi:hypothetical protein
MMEDTPSNYNIANGRLEGKSMGLKSIILYAKKQGINLGETSQPLEGIQEEHHYNYGNYIDQQIIESDNDTNWRNINQPIATQNTEGTERGTGKRGTKKVPSVNK